MNNVTRCADGTSLSSVCFDKGCNVCDGSIPEFVDPFSSIPNFFLSDFISVDPEDNLIVFCPDPNSDGYDPTGEGEAEWFFLFLRDCTLLGAWRVLGTEWPQTISIGRERRPPSMNLIGVSRRLFGHASVRVLYPFPPPKPDPIWQGDMFEVNVIQRWLLHIPKLEGGFKSALRFSGSGTMYLNGFDGQGHPLRTEVVSVDGIRVEPMGVGGLFADFVDEVSHIGVQGPFGTEVAVSYESKSSEFTSWVREVDFKNQPVVGRRFSMPARRTPDFQEGLAILNLANTQSADVMISHRFGSEMLGMVLIEGIGSGSKQLLLVSELFDATPDSEYVVEVTNEANIQIMGFDFDGVNFFAPKMITRH